MKERIRWIDIAKGFGIFFIVLGHVYTQPEFNKLLYAFHVPLFFFLSGLVFKADSIKKIIIHGVKRILFPYFIVAVISIIVFSFLGTAVFLYLACK